MTDSQQIIPLTTAESRVLSVFEQFPSRHLIPVYTYLNVNADVEKLRDAYLGVIKNNDAFQFRFSRDPIISKKYLVPFSAEKCPFRVYDFASLSYVKQQEKLYQTIEKMYSEIDIFCGPLVTAAVFDLGKQGKRFFLLLAHIVSDAVSAALIFRELGKRYFNATGVASPRTSLSEYSKRQFEYVKNLKIEPIPSERLSNPFYPNWQGAIKELGNMPIKKIVHKDFYTKIQGSKWAFNLREIAAAAYIHAVAEVFDRPSIALNVSSSGRRSLEQLSTSQTVGYLAQQTVALFHRGSDVTETFHCATDLYRHIDDHPFDYAYAHFIARQDGWRDWQGDWGFNLVGNHFKIFDLHTSKLFLPGDQLVAPPETLPPKDHARNPWYVPVNVQMSIEGNDLISLIRFNHLVQSEIGLDRIVQRFEAHFQDLTCKLILKNVG